jgi:hypothetical protein
MLIADWKTRSRAFGLLNASSAKENFIVQTVDRKDLSANRGRSFQVADLVVCQEVSPS